MRQPGIALQDHARAGFEQGGHPAGVQNFIADALFAPHQNRLAGHSFALPRGLREIAPNDPVCGPPAPFVFFPSLRHLADQKQAESELKMGIRVVWLGFYGAPVTGLRLIKPAKFLERPPKVGMGLGKIRIAGKGHGVTGKSLVELAETLERQPQVAVRLGIIRLERQRLGVRGNRRVQLPQFLKRIAKT